MVPFLHKDLGSCLHSLLALFVKREVLSAADTSAKLVKIDLSPLSLCSCKEIDIGFAAKTELLNSKVSHHAKAPFLSATSSEII